jgi:hypothetical protein
LKTRGLFFFEKITFSSCDLL